LAIIAYTYLPFATITPNCNQYKLQDPQIKLHHAASFQKLISVIVIISHLISTLGQFYCGNTRMKESKNVVQKSQKCIGFYMNFGLTA
jgi:hypothetical protein